MAKLINREADISCLIPSVLLCIALAFSGHAIANNDPTAPLGFAPQAKTSAAPQAALPQLQSILCRQTCNAIVNDEVVETGDSIAGYRITAISESVVKLARGGQNWELSLFSLDIKQ